MPRGSKAGREIKKIIDKEARKKDHKMLPVYEEKGVYNFYLQMSKSDIGLLDEPARPEDCTKDELVKLVKELRSASSTSSSGPSGGHRQPRKA